MDIARIIDNRWRKKVLEWRPGTRYRNVEWPPIRWTDDRTRAILGRGQSRSQQERDSPLTSKLPDWKRLNHFYATLIH
ncbi:hypothetical protein EVAR_86266_1 [Eumeta japonica]|uniref:Uncharacterized protein n=1 Tax=Eumeta variegata TaxID=151549 RepID=A0A4C1UC22_EUMVA|nr:hypothetical protein EVAR_86266_1 [Eumeta japonica]